MIEGWASEQQTFPSNNEIEDLSSENYSLEDEQYRIQNVIKNGFEILKGDSNTLLFDLDSEEALKIFQERIAILEKKAFNPIITISKSKSGNYHAVVKLGVDSNLLVEPLRIAIQACLGSDWKREFLGVLRYFNNQKEVSMLFRPQPLEIIKWP